MSEGDGGWRDGWMSVAVYTGVHVYIQSVIVFRVARRIRVGGNAQ